MYIALAMPVKACGHRSPVGDGWNLKLLMGERLDPMRHDVIRSRPIPASEITPEGLYARQKGLIGRRSVLVGGAATVSSLMFASGLSAAVDLSGFRPSGKDAGPFDTSEPATDRHSATHYNNFYEFGLGKEDPQYSARNFLTEPWVIDVEGEVEKPGKIFIEDLIDSNEIEERIYRLRCVEAWSMVIPWLGVPLRKIIPKFAPTSKAKFVEFVTLYDPSQMRGQRSSVLVWPYREGLRMDEAMNPLTLLAVGMYGDVLPNQNGAPIRLVVPWKYGFKSIKSIVKIRFREDMPQTSWNMSAPHEYGFYANVNPEVRHPRWSQARERRIGDFFKRDTLPFNGYAADVADLYAGMDLAMNF